MSSNMKDARWELASKHFTAISGLDWYELSYPERQNLLDAAQEVLNCLSETEIESLARRFRGEDD